MDAPQASASPKGGSELAYRPDIDGLRAIAVLAVIGYHFLPQWVPAGFVGVDIFFVISGYLISGIILARVEGTGFSLADFYGRRIRRIFPGLLLVLMASLALGALVLYADEYAQLGKHTAAGAAFVSNFALWLETGYFDNAAETKPLLHLWSLGVEEQFYLLWPLLLVHAARGRTGRAWLTGVLLSGSFAACVYATTRSADAAFYLPAFRIWELMAGAVLAQWPAPQPRGAGSAGSAHWRSTAGVLLLAVCCVAIDRGTAFPGWRAALPVLAAWLLIAAGPQGWFNRSVLARPWLVGIGLVSFPLYLWHWPLLSFFKILGNDAPLTLPRATALFTAALLLAWLTYAMLERPARARAHAVVKSIALLLAMSAMGGVGLWVSMQQGLPGRAVNDRDPTFASRDGRNATDVRAWLSSDCGVAPAQAALFGRCTRDARGTERYALLGDSKAEALFPGLIRTSTPQGRWLFIGSSTGHSSVLPVLTDIWHYAVYQEPSRVALEAVKRNPNVETVVLVAAARAFFHLQSPSSIDDLPASPFYRDAEDGLRRYVEQLVAAGKKVVLVVDNPTLPDPKRCMGQARVTAQGALARFFSIGEPDPRCTLELAQHMEWSAQYHRMLRSVAGTWPKQVAIFDPTPLLCDMAHGVCGAFDGTQLQYAFSDHLSDATSTKVGRALNEFLAASTDRKLPARASRPRP